MKISRIEIQLSHKIFVGGFETIEPCIRLCADLDPGENLDEARKLVAAEVQKLWAKEVIEELRIVHKRRNGTELPSNDKLPGLMQSFKEMAKGS